MAKSLTVEAGRVVSYQAGLQIYRVLLDRGGNPRPAVAVGAGGGAYGARESTRYPVGSNVLVASMWGEDRFSPMDYIIGGIPHPVANEALTQADHDVLGSATGWLADKIHTLLGTQYPEQGNRLNTNNGTPIDSLSGEWGVYSALGPAAYIGLMMAYLRASDRAGLWVFKQDELVRVMAKTHQIYTMGREYEDLFDAGELLTVDSHALYPWEALGAATNLEDVGQTPSVAKREDGHQYYDEDDPDFEPPLRPQQQMQRGIFRLREMTGYPADVRQRFLCLPLLNGQIDAYGQNQDQFPGVFREALGPDGSWLVQSAKSLTLEKWAAIPYPVEVAKTHDPDGDQAGDAQEDAEHPYQASGAFGRQKDDLPHYREDFEYLADEDSPELRAMLGLELHGFLAKHTIINLLRHRGDWYVPEERENALASAGEGDDRWTPLNIGERFQLDPDRQWMPLPKVREVPIDHRYRKARYYGSRSALQMLDDGSVVIEDGYGSQIIMTGGSIIQTAANDVLTLVGRDAITQAPRDIVQKAGRDVDVTSSYGDLRLKAEYNLMAIGGNSESRGGVLVESRVRGTTSEFDYTPGVQTDVQGLVLSSAFGAVGVLGQDVLVQAGQGSQPGDLVLRSSFGGRVHVDAQSMQARLDVSAAFLIGPRDEDDPFRIDNQVAYTFTQSSVELGYREDVGDAANAPAVVAYGVLQTFSGLADLSTSEDASELANDRAQAFLPAVEALNDILVGKGYSDGDEEDRVPVDNLWNPDAVAEQVRGSLRTDQDYGTAAVDSFRLFEMRWQQMAKASGASGQWIERPVPAGRRSASSLRQTMPWPGVTAWRDQQRLKVVRTDSPDQHFDIQAGISAAYDQELDAERRPVNRSEVEDRRLQDSFLVNHVPTVRS